MIDTVKKSKRPARDTLTAGEISELRDELLRELACREEALAEESRAPTIELDMWMHGRRAQIIDALKRMRAGTYGACATCGDPISYDRLLIVPETSMCIACARQLS
jgi:RNA polymerase-binding transcription factor DksA